MFAFAIGYIIKKFVWNPFGKRKNVTGKKIGDHSDCGSCTFH